MGDRTRGSANGKLTSALCDRNKPPRFTFSKYEVGIGVALFIAVLLAAADTLPERLSDEDYWKLISDFSEPDRFYQRVLTSNELQYQHVLPQITKLAPQGGVYLGVGPEQNFTYIAALRPRIAFLIDIRRDMMLEHLIYKALFETTTDRAEFVGKLFSRRRPSALTANASVGNIFTAYSP